MNIRVGINKDYPTISEAVEAVNYNEPATIFIDEGIYREKLFINKGNITLKGAGRGKTTIVFDDGAYDVLEDGSKRGTFRSYTVFAGGEYVSLQDLTVINEAGDGNAAGQALAVYADAKYVYMENVELLSHQDTLFIAPLPTSERLPGGFVGPGNLKSRTNTEQHYKNCLIKGDVDFIFGGGDAIFEKCQILVNNRNEKINGYIAAPCENIGSLGLFFKECDIYGEPGISEESVFLGRPWRPTGRAGFVDCRYDRCINTLGFSEWSSITDCDSIARFAEYKPVYMDGAFVDMNKRNSFVRNLSDKEAKALKAEAGKIEERINAIRNKSS